MNDRASHVPDAAASPRLAAPPDLALPTGMRLGAFEIQRVIAHSASAVVYLATDHALAMQVALKEYLPARLMRRDAGLRLIAAEPWHDDLIARGLRAFVDEARLLVRCEHPSLVRVHQLFDSHGTAYRVMPVYAGQRLSELRREMLAAPGEAALRALLDGLLGALEAIHRSGQVHGGVSAENILLLDGDRPLLLGPGAATREIGSDLVESLMATLESPADEQERTADAAAGTPPTGAVLDLCALAEVLRSCITAELPASPDALRQREPLASVIARVLPAETRPPYSAALLDTLDAAVSPFAQDRPLSVAQFRDWLARGVPAVPGGNPARRAPPAAVGAPRKPLAASAPMAPIAAPAPIRAPSPIASPSLSPSLSPAVTPAFTFDSAPRGAPPSPPAKASAASWDRIHAPHDGDEPLAPWPDLIRATEPSPTGFADPRPAPLPSPLPSQLQRLTKSRQHRHKWALGAVLALLAAVVLAVATGAWNRAPEIALGPQAARIDTTPPAPTHSDAPVAAAANVAPAVAQTAAEPRDPARILADEPPAAGPAQAAPIAEPEASPQTASVAPTTVVEAVEPDEAVEPVAPKVAPARTAPRAPPVRVAAAPAGAGPRAACSGRTEFALYRCMQLQCQAKRWATHPQCIRLHRDDRVD